MAFLTETKTWTTGVYQIEKNDDVLGGPAGPDNKPHKDLANRTGFLKKALGTIAEVN